METPTKIICPNCNEDMPFEGEGHYTCISCCYEFDFYEPDIPDQGLW
jgi:tRNA(Ile2) C34 agmatinyltransferase TiaS